MSLSQPTIKPDTNLDIIPLAPNANNLSTLNPANSNSPAHIVPNASSSISGLAHQVAQHILTNISEGNDKSTSMAKDAASDTQWLDMPKMENFVDFFTICCSIAVIFGGLVPYIPQYLKIKRSMNSDGFSTYVCLTLLIANILRIMFWFGHRFELPLLIQSFVIIAGMLAMMEICIRVKNKDSPYTISAIGINANQRRRIVNGKMNETNECANDNSSIHDSESMPIYSVLSSSASSTLPDSISSCSYHNQIQPQTIDIRIAQAAATTTPAIAFATTTSSSCESSSFESSSLNDDTSSQLCQTSLLSNRTIKCFIAVFTESMLGMPQLLRNYAKKSTAGMSVEMVIMWLSGDLFKTLYFILRRAPVQFYVCGSIQVVVDILILVQVLWYKRPNVTYRKLPKST